MNATRLPTAALLLLLLSQVHRRGMIVHACSASCTHKRRMYSYCDTTHPAFRPAVPHFQCDWRNGPSKLSDVPNDFEIIIAVMDAAHSIDNVASITMPSRCFFDMKE